MRALSKTVSSLAVAAVLLALPAYAAAGAPIQSYSAVPSTTQAGGHPDVLIRFKVKSRFQQQSQSACNCEDVKDATVHLPTGLIGNPSATPKCEMADFSADECSVDSVIGAVEVNVGSGEFIAAVYNLVPPPDVAGLTAFKLGLFNTPQFSILTGRTESDYGLDATTTSIYHGSIASLQAFNQIIWGVPADPRHDALRIDTRNTILNVPWVLLGGTFCDEEGKDSTDDPLSVYKPCGGLIPAPSNSPEIPFLQNPTRCAAPLESTLDVLAYDGETDRASRPWPQPTGCFQLSFNPSLYAHPTTGDTDSASGIDLELTVPQPLSPSVPSASELQEATLVLPEGFSINANAADGKSACADEEARFGTRLAAECPEFAKIGSLEIDSSALPGPLPGFVYLGQPLPGERYRLILAADGFGTHIKLAGTITADPQTGQLTTIFKNLPQSPLTAFRMHVFGSERGALATPTKCGSYEVKSTFVSWNERIPAQTSSQFFTLDRGPSGAPCPSPARPFSPRFEAASAGNTAGSFAPFSADLSRADGEQNFTGIDVTTPPGFSASIKGVPYCPDGAIAQLASPLYSGAAEIAGSACPAASRVGSAIAAAGAGSRPLHVTGQVYLAGPYKGAPVSLVVVVPAVSGPYDLGNVVARAAAFVDPLTAQIRTVSDPLPQIVEGVPLRVRSIRLDLDRPDFTLNPTNCDPHRLEGTAFGDEGGRAPVGQFFQVANCASLPFDPKFGMTLSGGVARRGHPAIRAILTKATGEANLKRVSVTLPKGLLLDNSHFDTICTRVDFAKETCPSGSKVGEATVWTPLLDEPARGSVYLRSSDNDLPDLALDLEGQVDIVAVGRVDSFKARLRTTFEALPDVPVSRIDVRFAGGRKGLVVNSEGLCGHIKRATVSMLGQNGVELARKPRVKALCGGVYSKARRDKHRGGKERG